MTEFIDKLIPKNGEVFRMDIPYDNGLARTVSVERRDPTLPFLYITIIEKSPCSSEDSYAFREFVLKTGPKYFPHALRSYHDGGQHLGKSGELVRKWVRSTDPYLLEGVSDQSSGSLCKVSFEDAAAELAVVLDAIERTGQSEERGR